MLRKANPGIGLWCQRSTKSAAAKCRVAAAMLQKVQLVRARNFTLGWQGHRVHHDDNCKCIVRRSEATGRRQPYPSRDVKPACRIFACRTAGVNMNVQ